jgi:hypothetical protein
MKNRLLKIWEDVLCMSILIPVFYYMLKFIFNAINEDTKSTVFFSLFFYPSVLCILYYLAFSCEKAIEYGKRVISAKKLLLIYILIYLSIVILFANIYFCLYDIDKKYFSDNTTGNKVLETYFHFLYYSLGIMTTNNISNILATNLITKIISFSQMFVSFIYIIIIISNYSKIGNIVKNEKENNNESLPKEESKEPPKESNKECFQKFKDTIYKILSQYFLLGVIIILLGTIIFCLIPKIDISNNYVGIILSFVGIAATFVVVSNFAQVKDIEGKFESKVKEIEGRNEQTKEYILDTLGSEIEESKNQTDKEIIRLERELKKFIEMNPKELEALVDGLIKRTKEGTLSWKVVNDVEYTSDDDNNIFTIRKVPDNTLFEDEPILSSIYLYSFDKLRQKHSDFKRQDNERGYNKLNTLYTEIQAKQNQE